MIREGSHLRAVVQSQGFTSLYCDGVEIYDRLR
jgi:hypothetical protein